MTCILKLLFLCAFTINGLIGQRETYCPPQELIAPCRCSQREDDIQVWYKTRFCLKNL